MPNILIITYDFPPYGGPAVQRITKFVKYFKELNYTPIIITSKHKKGAKDETLTKEIPLNTKVNSLYDYGSYIPGELRNNLLKSLFIPDKQRFWGVFDIKKIEKIIKKNDIKIIFSTSPPHSVHLLAYKIKEIFKIPWVVDFRDEWTKNPDFNNNEYQEKNIHLEQKIIETADHITVCTKTSKENFEIKYNLKNISLVMNGYDSEDFNEINPSEIDESTQNQTLNILYFGRLNKTHSINSLLIALSELKNENPNNYNIKLKVIGDNSERIWLKNFPELEGYVTFIPYIPHIQCLKEAAKSDVLLLLATSMKNTEFIPAKTFEYFKLRKPILGILSKSKELRQLLMNYQNSFLAMEDNIFEVKSKLKELVEKKQNSELKLSENYSFIDSFNRIEQTKKLVEIFDSLLKK